MKYKAALMIFLILTIPFYISSASAIVNPDSFPVSIKQVRVYGNLRNQTKALLPTESINVEALITDTGVNPPQVKFTTSGSTVPFQSCFADPQGTKCGLVITPPTALTEGAKTYTVTYTPTGANPVQISGTYVVDKTPPVINSFGTSTGVVGISNGKVAVSYTVTDSAAASSATCAGVAGILISRNAQFTDIFSDSKIDVSSIQECQKNGVLEVNAPVLDGQFTWYAKAYDRLGNTAFSVKTATFTVDAVAPEISNVRLFRGEYNTTLVASGQGSYIIKANIRESNGLQSAALDIGGQSSCLKIDTNNYECSWPVQLLITETTRTVSGKITAKDSPGNSRDYSFSIGVSVDSQAPSVGFFGSTYGSYLRGGGNTLYVHAQDPEGDPITVNNVYADLHLLGAYGSQVRPNECKGEYCYWYNIVTTKSNGAVAVAKVWVGDSFGHYNSLQTAFTVDKNPPVINEIVRSIEFPTKEDEEYLYFVINASDDSGVRNVTANISVISNMKGLAIAECDDHKLSSACFIYTPELKTSYAVGDIVFTVYDKAGNSVVQKYPMLLYEADVNSIPEEIKSVNVKSVSPKKLDRKIAEKIPVKVFLDLDYEYEHDNVEVVDQTIDCVNLTKLGLLYQTDTDNPYLIGEDYLVFDIVLNNLTAKLDKIKFNCTMNLKIRRGGVVFLNPEQQTLSAEIELYNLPLGTVGEGVINKLEDIQTVIDDWFGWAETTDKWFQTAIKICDGFGVFQQAYNILQTFKPILFPILNAIEKYPPAKGAANAIWKYYNMGMCYMKVGKDWAWPNTNPSNLGTGSQEKGTGNQGGFFYSMSNGNSFDFKGIVRNICSLVKCRQCNTDWSVANRLANLNFDFGGTGSANASTKSTTLNTQMEGNNATKESIFKNVDLSVAVDPFRSWAVAAACLCIPGLIHNAKKYRQLECMHANCIIENAKAGFSVGPCDSLDRERKCVFFWGALFQLIPGYLFAQMIVNKITAVITQLPGRLIGAARNWYCNNYDTAIKESGYLEQCDSAKDCQDPTKQPQSLPDAKNSNYITCSVIDAGMLIWSWNDFADNAMDFKKYFNFEEEQDFCESVDWEAAGLD